MPQAILSSFYSADPIFPGPAPDFRVDASQIVGLSDGDPVAAWPDVSGNSRDFTQATPANRPIYKTGGLAGRPYVDFVTSDSLVASTLPTPVSSYTLFIVLRNTTSVTQFAFYWGTSANGMGIGFVSPQRSVQHRNGGATVNCLDDTYTVNIGEAWTIRRNSAGPLLEFWVDGVSEAITNSTSAMGALSAAAIIGAFNPAAPSAFWSGDVFEIIGYASVLTDPERVAIENYLIAKYGL